MALCTKEIGLLLEQVSRTQLKDLSAPSLLIEGLSPNSIAELTEIARSYPQTYHSFLQSLRADKNNLACPVLSEQQRTLELIARYRFENPTDGSPLQLRWHQNACMERFHKMLERGQLWGWIQLPTGSGKTPLEVALISAVGKKAIILEPTLELVDNAIKELNSYAPHLTATKFNGDVKDTSGDVIVCTYQSLGCLISHLQYAAVEYGMVVLDEAHEALSPLRKDLVHGLAKDKILVALTATPSYSELKSVEENYGECLYKMTLSEGFDYGLLAEPRHFLIGTNVDLNDLEESWDGKDWESFTAAQLNKILKIESRNRVSINILKLPQFAGLPTLVSCYSVKHATEWADLAQEAGISARVVHGGMSIDERKDIYEQYSSGLIQAISYVEVLKLGWNEPRATICMNLRDTDSALLAEQRFGRVTRLFELKDFCYSFDFYDRTGTMSGITVPELLKDRKLPTVGSSKDSSDNPEDADLIRKNEEYRALVEAIKPALNGEFDIAYDLEEVVVARKKSNVRIEQPDSTTPLTTDDFATILSLNGFSAIDAKKLERVDDFLRLQFSHELFSGSGATLLKKFLESRNEEGTIGGKTLSRFFNEIFKDRFSGELKQNYLAELRQATLAEFLKQIGCFDSVSAYQQEEIPFGRPPKATTVSTEEVIQRLFPDGHKPQLDDFGISEIIHRYFDNFGRASESIEALYEAWDSTRTLHELSESGILQAIILNIPSEVVQDFEQFKQHSFTIAGRNLTGKTILDYYQVKNLSDFATFSLDLTTMYAEHTKPIPDPEMITASRLTILDARNIVRVLATSIQEEPSQFEFTIGPRNAKVTVNYQQLLDSLRMRDCFGSSFLLDDEGIRTLAKFAMGSEEAAKKVLESHDQTKVANLLVERNLVRDLLASTPAMTVCDYDGFCMNTLQTSMGTTTGKALVEALEIDNEYDWIAWLKENSNGSKRTAIKNASELILGLFIENRNDFTVGRSTEKLHVPIGNGMTTSMSGFSRIAFNVRSYRPEEFRKVFSRLVDVGLEAPLLTDIESDKQAKDLFNKALAEANAQGLEIKATSDIPRLLPVLIPGETSTVGDLLTEWCYRNGFFTFNSQYDDEFRNKGIQLFLEMRKTIGR